MIVLMIDVRTQRQRFRHHSIQHLSLEDTKLTKVYILTMHSTLTLT